jgi:predicted GIY-YIG superfamily endonuclease
MGQLLLIPDPRPLDERLGRKFFRTAPKRPGVYLMRDAQDKVLYVGKAKDLHQRLQNYRIANPDRMPRRHLKMLRQVARIDLQLCPAEKSALKHESRLLRSLKPQFNRAGVWPGKPQFFAWRRHGEILELACAETPETGWLRFGPLGGSHARRLHSTLCRMLWLAVNPARALTDLPAGWSQGRIPATAIVQCGPFAETATAALNAFFWQTPETLTLWAGAQFSNRIHPFERQIITSDLEALAEFAASHAKKKLNHQQMALL